MSENETNQITWAIHTTHPEIVEQVREKLSEVVDPEIGMNIIQLGLVREVEIEDDVARLKMILTTPFCPYGPALLEMTRAKAEIAAEKPATIEMGMELWDQSMMEDDAAAEWGLF